MEGDWFPPTSEDGAFMSAQVDGFAGSPLSTLTALTYA